MGNRRSWERRFPEAWQRPFEAALLFIITSGCLGFATWAHFPLLRVEFQRLPAWQLALLFAADLAGLGLFVRALVRYASEVVRVSDHDRYVAIYYNRRGTLPATASLDPKKRPFRKQVLRVYLLSFGIPWVIDLSASLALRQLEQADFRQATVVGGEVREVEQWEAVKRVCKYRYHLHCSFRDATGQPHETVQIVDTDERGKLNGRLPPATVTLIERGRGPFPIRIAYLPDAPYQAWLADVGPGYGWNLHRFSLEILFGQLFLMLILVFGPLVTTAEGGNGLEFREPSASLPLCLKETVPLLIEAAFVALAGYMQVTTFVRL